MPSVHDVAAFILEECGPLRSAKLHELVYYAQAWSLGVRGAPLFAEPIHAWKRGPVVYELLEQHRNRYTVKRLAAGASASLAPEDILFVRQVLGPYRSLSTRDLTELTRSEPPWRTARGSADGARATTEDVAVIAHDDMRSFYGSAPPLRERPTRERAVRRVARAARAAASQYGGHLAVLIATAALLAKVRR